jgi:hypothetical protein
VSLASIASILYPFGEAAPAPVAVGPGGILTPAGDPILTPAGAGVATEADPPAPEGGNILTPGGDRIVTPDGLGLASDSAELPTITFRRALRFKLGSIDGLAAIVGNRIYPGLLPRNYDLLRDGPSVTFSVEKERGRNVVGVGHVLSGSDGTTLARVQVSAWAAAYSAADEIGEVLFAALDGLVLANWYGIDILSCVREQQVDLPEAPTTGSVPVIYQIANEFQVRYRVAIPTHRTED